MRSWLQVRARSPSRRTRGRPVSCMARTISARLGDLFTKGAEVVDTSFMGAHVLMLRNAGGDVRMGSTEVLRKP